jgi:hypothetical protein
MFLIGQMRDNTTYGIEAYFAPEKKAQILEKEMGQGGIAVVMVAKNGKAALKEVIPARGN